MVLKFFDVVLKFELPRARCLNFPKNSASVLIRLVLIIGDNSTACSIIRQFHNFFQPSFWRVFDVWPNCVPTGGLGQTAATTPINRQRTGK